MSLFCEKWGDDLRWINKHDGGPHEASFLKLNNDKIKEIFGWKPRWHISDCMNKIVDFSKIYLSNPEDIPFEMDREISEFFGV